MTAKDWHHLLGSQQAQFHPVVPFRPDTDKLLPLDLSGTNTDIRHFEPGSAVFHTYIRNLLQQSGARYAIGGYAEHRVIYSFSRVFDPGQPGEEPRRLHLGTDIWGKSHTPVMAPTTAIVHSFANNDQPGDYGATIILSHQWSGHHYHTLYGHLSLSSIRNMREGKRIESGEVFAELGIPAENGQWPPHLHFQIILDLNDWKGDYPGVCALSQKEQWLSNSPDPDTILQLNQFISS